MKSFPYHHRYWRSVCDCLFRRHLVPISAGAPQLGLTNGLSEDMAQGGGRQPPAPHAGEPRPGYEGWVASWPGLHASRVLAVRTDTTRLHFSPFDGRATARE